MKSITCIWIVALATKLLVSYLLPLSFDESYYWVWGHHLQLSYFDHPAFVSWLYWLGQPFENLGNAVRWPGVLLGHLTLLIWVQILKPILSPAKLRNWLLLAILTPLFGIGSIIITPDIPLMFFWSLSLLILIQCEKKMDYRTFIYLGISLGLGFLAKYHIVVFLPLGFLWLYQRNKLSKATIGPIFASIVAFLVASSPLLYWNYSNDFISFTFQLNHGLNEEHWNPMWPLKFLFDQVLLIFPLVLIWCFSRNKAEYTGLLKIFAWGPIVFFLLATFKADSEANWTIAAYPAILALAVYNTNKSWWIKTTCSIWFTLFLVVITEAFFHWLPIAPEKNKTMEFVRFDSIIAAQVANPEITPLFASSFQMAGKISYETKQQVYKLKGVNRVDFYDFRPEATPSGNRFYLAAETDTPIPQWVEEQGFKNTEVYETTSKYIIRRFDRP